MSLFRSFIVLAMCTLLQACGPQYQTHYTIVPPTTEMGRMCANNCLMSKQQCQQSCSMQQQACDSRAQLEARNDYLEYVNERQRQGKELKKGPNDFSGFSSCPEIQDCQQQCEGNYHICHTNCGGQVIPQTVCVMNCNQ